MRIRSLLAALLFGGSLAIAGVAVAQNPGGHMLTRQQMIEKRLAHMKRALKLTDAQTDQLKSIWQQNADKLKADHQAVETAAKGDARKDAMKQMRTDEQDMRKQMAAVLTPEQRKKFKQMKLQMLERRERHIKKEEQRLKQK